MSFISVDVESDGRIQGTHSIVCFGAVVVEPTLSKTFYGKIRPISDTFVPEALKISGFSREEHLTFDEPEKVMSDFADWIKIVNKGKPIFISDNNGYDFSWINWYFHTFYGKNPFGWYSRRIGDIYCGMVMDPYASWKYLRITRHDHNPLNVRIGNAEALLKMQEMGLKIDFK
jgi:hypothetical protein